MSTTPCCLCGHPVGNGKGDRHRKNSCPPPRGKKAKKCKQKKEEMPVRGVVATTGTRGAKRRLNRKK